MPEDHKNSNYDYLKTIIEVIPEKPGVYQYYDASGSLIYVGKAKNLKKRVASYFTRTHYESNKLRLLVRRIADIKHIVVDTESDALLLENNLIKKYQPRYNVQLKDDKTFPWICVKNEPFPRVFSTRILKDDGSVYYGPYTSGLMVKTIIELIRQLFPLRTCQLNLAEEHIKQGKYKVCLEYHIGNCLGPCVGNQDQEEYKESIDQVHQILKGNIQQVSNYLKVLMKQYAGEFKFEQAQAIKHKLEIIRKFRSKSTIVNPKINNIDVFSIVEEEKYAFVNYMKVINGAIIQSHNLEIKKQLNEDQGTLLQLAIIDIRNKIPSDAREIVIPFNLDIDLQNIRFLVPVKGDKKKLLDLSTRNVKYYQLEQSKQRNKTQLRARNDRILNTVMKDLRLNKAPRHIECFDNSNIQGKEPVASCVVFRDTKPSKKEYRYFNIKTVKGADDYASMAEIITRRYKRMLAEKQELPQLIVIDGGKGQLNAAVSSLDELTLRGKIAVIGIAKKLEEIYFPGDSVPLYIDKNSETLKLIQQLRNEAHRFGIEFHRRKRRKKMTASVLDDIRGIGRQTKDKLLSAYPDIEHIIREDEHKLSELIGKSKSKILLNYLKKERRK